MMNTIQAWSRDPCSWNWKIENVDPLTVDLLFEEDKWRDEKYEEIQIAFIQNHRWYSFWLHPGYDEFEW